MELSLRNILIILEVTSALVASPARAQIRDGKTDWKVIDEKVFIPSHPYSLFRPDTVSVSLIGDVMMHSPQFVSAHKIWLDNGGDTAGVSVHDQYDFSTFFCDLESDLKGADLAVANMEFALGGTPFSGYPCFSAPDSYADYVEGLGVDVFLTANNHILDKAPSGASRTLDHYGKMGVRYTGSGLDSLDFVSRNPLLLRVKGLHLAIVNLTYGTNVEYDTSYPRIFRQTDTTEVAAAMSRARDADADVIIVIPHWGIEYRHVHSAEQHETARMLAEMGADVIIGAHPHVVQDMEIIVCGGREVPVYYSLGNAVSNMSAPGTQLELLARVDVVRYKNGDVKILPPEHEWLWCSRPGDLRKGYSVVKVAGQKREDWINKTAFDKMTATLESVRAVTGLK